MSQPKRVNSDEEDEALICVIGSSGKQLIKVIAQVFNQKVSQNVKDDFEESCIRTILVEDKLKYLLVNYVALSRRGVLFADALDQSIKTEAKATSPTVMVIIVKDENLNENDFLSIEKAVENYSMRYLLIPHGAPQTSCDEHQKMECIDEKMQPKMYIVCRKRLMKTIENQLKKRPKEEFLRAGSGPIPNSSENYLWSSYDICYGTEAKVTITERGRSLKIVPSEEKPKEAIEITFPEMCVLGSRMIGIEVILTQNKNIEACMDTIGVKMLTPVVQITQETHVCFLKPVKVTLPVNSREDSLEVKKEEHGCQISVKDGLAEIKSFVFSPAGLYKTLEEVVKAMCLGDKVDKMLHENSAYLMVEQELSKKLDFFVMRVSFRPFRGIPEHEKYRREMNKFFSRIYTQKPMTPWRMTTNEAFKRFTLEWNRDFLNFLDHAPDTSLTFSMGDVDDPNDWSGPKELKYRFGTAENVDRTIKFRFDNDERNFELHNKQKLEELAEQNERYIPSRLDLLRCLDSVKCDWLEFMQDCLKVDKMDFAQFILKDVEETNAKKEEKDVEETNAKKEEKVPTKEIEAKYEYHVRLQIIDQFKLSVFGVGETAQLSAENLDNLAEVLRYVDEDKLKEAFRKGRKEYKIDITETSEQFRRWLSNGDERSLYHPAEPLQTNF